MTTDHYISDYTRFLNGVEYLTSEGFRRLFRFDRLGSNLDIRQDNRGHSFIRHICLSCRKAYAVAVGTHPDEGNHCEECTQFDCLPPGRVIQFINGQEREMAVDDPTYTRKKDSDVCDSLAYINASLCNFDQITQRRLHEADKPWTPSEESVAFANELIEGIVDDPTFPRKKYPDVCDPIAYINASLCNFDQITQRRLHEAEIVDRSAQKAKSLLRYMISNHITDDLEYARVLPRECSTVLKERWSIAGSEVFWRSPSECLTTKPLPKMLARI